MSRVVDLDQGVAYVVTDLHGEWGPYCRYRDHFLALHQRGQADVLIFLGDVIHGYGRAEDDYSLNMLWDIMQLQVQFGPQTVMMILGNHELPHIYGVALSKGDREFTSRFERTLGEYRAQVLEFLKSLPFCIRTSGGTMLTHAGATTGISTPATAAQLLNFSHDALLGEADRLMARSDVLSLIASFMTTSPEEYDRMARYYLAVSGQDDPRYYDLLRGFIVGNLAEWQPLWDFVFNQCEAGLSLSFYKQVLEQYLKVYSADRPQHVLVTGHMAVRGAYAVIAEQQLRLASSAHATPRDAGCYLRFDVTTEIRTASDLIPFVHPMP